MTALYVRRGARDRRAVPRPRLGRPPAARRARSGARQLPRRSTSRAADRRSTATPRRSPARSATSSPTPSAGDELEADVGGHELRALSAAPRHVPRAPVDRSAATSARSTSPTPDALLPDRTHLFGARIARRLSRRRACRRVPGVGVFFSRRGATESLVVSWSERRAGRRRRGNDRRRRPARDGMDAATA